MPSLNASGLRNSFGQISSQRMTITPSAVTIESPTRARVVAQVVHENRPRSGAPFTFDQPQTFILEKRNGAWIVLERK
jgi:hypothetical protein